MAEETRFFERQVDRTAWKALWGLTAIIILLWLSAAYGLWQLGSWISRSQLPHLPHITIFNPAAALRNAQNKASASASAETHKAQNSAKQQASDQFNQLLSK